MAHRLLLAVDPAEQKVLEEAQRLGHALGSHVVMVHALVPSVPLTSAAAARATRQNVEAGRPQRDEVESALLQPWADGLRETGLAVDVVCREGDPAELVLEEAEANDVDLVVMGRRGRLLGPVSKEVLRRSRRPVLVVPAAPD